MSDVKTHPFALQEVQPFQQYVSVCICEPHHKMDMAPARAKAQQTEAGREPLVLTVKEAASWLKYSEKKIYDYISKDILKPLPGSRSYRIPFSQVKALCGE